jgi:Tfp pilus assembly protein PilF
VVLCPNHQCLQPSFDADAAQCQHCGAHLKILNRYEVVKLLATESRITQTYEVWDAETRTSKILKIVHSERTEFLEPLMAAAIVLRQIHTPTPVPGIPIAENDSFFNWKIRPDLPESFCLVVSKIEGITLSRWLQKGHQLSQSLAVDWLRQIVKLIEQFHRRDFIHRDLTPDNIVVQPSGQLGIIDFDTIQQMTWSVISYASTGGVGILAEQPYSLHPGTVGYIAPEQSEGRATFVSDFFSIGRTLIHLLTGIPPTALAVDLKTRKLIWRKKASKIDPLFADLIDRMTEPNPLDRPLHANWILNYLDKLPAKLKRRAILRSKFVRFTAVGLTGLALIPLVFGIRKTIANYYWLEGNRLQEISSYPAAKINYERALSWYENADIHSNLAMSCLLSEDVACAVKHFEAALKIDPNHERSNYNFANLLEDQGDFVQAKKHYKKATVPSSVESVRYLAINNLARLQILEGYPNQAIETIKPFLNQTNDIHILAAFYKNLGWAALQKRSFNQANEWLKKSLQLDTNRTDTHCLLAQVKRQQGRLKEAIPLEVDCLTMPTEASPEVEEFKLQILQRMNLLQKQF